MSMNARQKEWRQKLSELPVVDVHTHFESYTDTFGYNMPRFLYFSSYTVCYSNYFPASLTALMDDPDADPRKQYTEFLRMKDRIRHTTTGRFLDAMAQKIGIPFSEESYDALNQWYASRTYDSIRRETPTVKAFIANSPGHPLYGGLEKINSFWDEQTQKESAMRRSAVINELHAVHDKQELEKIAKVSGQPINSLREWEEACGTIIRKLADSGIASYKDLYLYFRPAEIHMPDQEKAGRDFEKVMRGEKATTELMDYMMFKVYELISHTGLPVQIHTGSLLDSAMTAMAIPGLVQIIKAFPNTSFDLLHLNYPMLEAYEAVLRTCGNAYGDATWIFTTDPAYTLRYLDYALDVLPADRTCFFGSDRHCAGVPVAACLDMADDILAEFFSRKEAEGRLTAAEGMDIARMWLYENPKNLFQIRD